MSMFLIEIPFIRLQTHIQTLPIGENFSLKSFDWRNPNVLFKGGLNSALGSLAFVLYPFERNQIRIAAANGIEAENVLKDTFSRFFTRNSWSGFSGSFLRFLFINSYFIVGSIGLLAPVFYIPVDNIRRNFVLLNAETQAHSYLEVYNTLTKSGVMNLYRGWQYYPQIYLGFLTLFFGKTFHLPAKKENN